METEIARQLAAAHMAITLLVAAVLVAVGYILSAPLPPEVSQDPTCPLHKQPRSKCKPESH